MAFDYAVGGKRKTLKAGVDVAFLSTKQAGGFVGTMIGPLRMAASPLTTSLVKHLAAVCPTATKVLPIFAYFVAVSPRSSSIGPMSGSLP
jgi:hypothetical protein